MKKHLTHRIKERSEDILRTILPDTWVLAAQTPDYAKDYLLELGDGDGNLTGVKAFVQLKGQAHVLFTNDRKYVKFTLESKYAKYYHDKVTDLPLFLFVIDVTQGKGWWVFLQPVLAREQSWRSTRSFTVHIPTQNKLTSSAKLARAIEEANQRMRRLHPEAIQDSVAAVQEHVRSLDPRFNATLVVQNGQPAFQLVPTEDVTFTLSILGDAVSRAQKVSALLDKGELVRFEPGEIQISGTKLLESLGLTGGEVRISVDAPASLCLSCRSETTGNVARLGNMAGRFTGGRAELRFHCNLENSPLSFAIDPIRPTGRCRFNIAIDPARWNGQPLLHLAYFDMIHDFVATLMQSKGVAIECHVNGNVLFSISLPMHEQPLFKEFGKYLTSIKKARAVARSVGINPLWDNEAFNRESREVAEQMYAVLFEGGWSSKIPGVTMTLAAMCRKVAPKMIRELRSASDFRVDSTPKVTMMGCEFEVGRLSYEYFGVKLIDKSLPSRSSQESSSEVKVKFVFRGLANAVHRIRKADEQNPTSY